MVYSLFTSTDTCWQAWVLCGKCVHGSFRNWILYRIWTKTYIYSTFWPFLFFWLVFFINMVWLNLLCSCVECWTPDISLRKFSVARWRCSSWESSKFSELETIKNTEWLFRCIMSTTCLFWLYILIKNYIYAAKWLLNFYITCSYVSGVLKGL